VIKGRVTIKNTSNDHQWVSPGTYSDRTIDLAAKIQDESSLAKHGFSNYYNDNMLRCPSPDLMMRLYCSSELYARVASIGKAASMHSDSQGKPSMVTMAQASAADIASGSATKQGETRQQAQEAAQQAREAARHARQLANGMPTPTKKQREDNQLTTSDSEVSTAEEETSDGSWTQGNDQPATEVAYAVNTLPSIDVEIVERLETFFGNKLLSAKAEEVVSKGVARADLENLLSRCPRLQFYRVSVPKPYPGVQYRKTKHVDDRYQRYAEDGAVLVGQAEDDGQWFKISTNVFVPMFVGKIRVLKPVLRPEESADLPLSEASDGAQSENGQHRWQAVQKAANQAKLGKRRMGEMGRKKDCCVQ